MTWAPQEVQKTLYTVLSTDSALQTLLGGTVGDPKVYDHVPDNKVYPYVTIGEGTFTDRGNHSWNGNEAPIQINVWWRPNTTFTGKGRKPVHAIQKRIYELLHDQNPDVCFEGWNVIVFRQQTVDILVEPDNVTLHGVQIFKLFLGEA